ncbi:MAG: hypothetical protein ACR5LF_00415 [Symbiopectobacterium sp.]
MRYVVCSGSSGRYHQPDNRSDSAEQSQCFLPNKVSAVDARKAGRVAYDKPMPENTIMLFIDQQVGLMASTRDFNQASGYKANVVALQKWRKR